MPRETELFSGWFWFWSVICSNFFALFEFLSLPLLILLFVIVIYTQHHWNKYYILCSHVDWFQCKFYWSRSGEYAYTTTVYKTWSERLENNLSCAVQNISRGLRFTKTLLTHNNKLTDISWCYCGLLFTYLCHYWCVDLFVNFFVNFTTKFAIYMKVNF